MHLTKLSIEHFRSYTKKQFNFSKNTTVVVGANTAGKTNLIEAIYFLSSGKSFRAEKDLQAVQFDQELARIKGEVDNAEESTQLELVLTTGLVGGQEAPFKKYLVNGVSKRRADFTGNFPVVLFSPADVDIIVGSPGLRRDFLDEVLEQVDSQYRLALQLYTKALRQRNALLERAKDEGRRNERLFEYWDELLIRNGSVVTFKRNEFIEYVNKTVKNVFDCRLAYDKSVISKERLLQYKNAEQDAGVTLVGPHRDDMFVYMQKQKQVKLFGSRGQQRLTILQLKILQFLYIQEKTFSYPTLLLDDIFSELDQTHIDHVFSVAPLSQTIFTTTHEEFIKRKKDSVTVIEL